ncbi:hypothetical protein AWU65_28060 [Paenibacillus glucanolyticus]|uniref:Uncharacterized protein n=1 Tax=Paenibacillus glucanolyticus TaxID=59843 RepID=A0A163EPV9_9BACL|nr:hypothetical protein AWU65_28060 [Paenibacillus glucanolyticus]
MINGRYLVSSGAEFAALGSVVVKVLDLGMERLPVVQLHKAFIARPKKAVNVCNRTRAVCFYWMQAWIKRRIKVASVRQQG